MTNISLPSKYKRGQIYIELLLLCDRVIPLNARVRKLKGQKRSQALKEMKLCLN